MNFKYVCFFARKGKTATARSNDGECGAVVGHFDDDGIATAAAVVALVQRVQLFDAAAEFE